MPDLKPAYLLSGDDDAKLDAWRTRVRTRAESEGGTGALETYDARSDAPGAVAAATTALTFGEGSRYVLADQVQAWKVKELDPLERALAAPAPDTVVVLLARGKAPERLAKAVKGLDGEIREFAAPKPWAMPKWVVERAREEGLRLDQEAAKALVGVVGTGQQRLARELEKLALAVHPRAQVSAEEIQELAAPDGLAQAYDLADALVARDLRRSLALAERLREAQEPPGRLVYPIVRRLREVQRASELLESGVPESGVAGAMRMPSWAAKRVVAQAKKADREALELALIELAELERDLRGGGERELDADTAFSLTLGRIAS